MAEYPNCPNCGQPTGPDDRYCSNCGQPLERRPTAEPAQPAPPEPIESLSAAPVPPTPIPPLPAPEEEPKYVMWEDRAKVGFFKALWGTWKESVFYPSQFFAKAPPKGGFWNPLSYAIIVAWMGYAINQMVGLIFSSMTLGFLANFIENEELFDQIGLYGGYGFIQIVLFLMILPFATAAFAFIVSGIYHILLILFGGNKNDYEATFRAVTYGAGPLMFLIIPACGSPIAYIWVLVLTIIGIRHLQRTSTGQAALAVLLPLFLCCCLVAFMAAIFGATIIGFFQNAMHGGYYFD